MFWVFVKRIIWCVWPWIRQKKAVLILASCLLYVVWTIGVDECDEATLCFGRWLCSYNRAFWPILPSLLFPFCPRIYTTRHITVLARYRIIDPSSHTLGNAKKPKLSLDLIFPHKSRNEVVGGLSFKGKKSSDPGAWRSDWVINVWANTSKRLVAAVCRRTFDPTLAMTAAPHCTHTRTSWHVTGV